MFSSSRWPDLPDLPDQARSYFEYTYLTPGRPTNRQKEIHGAAGRVGTGGDEDLPEAAVVVDPHTAVDVKLGESLDF